MASLAQQGSWDVNKLTPLQLRMILRTMALRKNKDLGAMELAGLLQEGGSFIPTNWLRRSDISPEKSVSYGRTLGLHTPKSTPLGTWPAHIEMNRAFPGNWGATFGHELAHNAFGRYGIRGGDRQHDLIGPYLAQNYRRSGKPVVMRKGEDPVLRHQQVGPDVSRRIGPIGPYAEERQHYIPANPNLYFKGSVPASGEELGLPFTVKDIEGELARSEEGRRRRAWWNANRAALARRMASITGGRGR